MEDWQKTHITKNLPELIYVTKFDWAVKAELLAENIIHQADVKKVDAVEKQYGEIEACGLYYQLLLEREGSYKVLTKALIKYNQTGASGILIRVPTELCSKPLTYLGISTKMTCFQDVDIEIYGQIFKLLEFFHESKHRILQEMFRAKISEVQFYETFVTRTKKFILATNTIPPKPPYYVPRFISNRIKLNESVFKRDCMDVFVFKNTIERYKLSQIVRPNYTADSASQLIKITTRFICLEEIEDWITLKEKCTNVPIHLINYETDGNHFILEDTSATSEILKKLSSQNKRAYMSEQEFVQQQLSKNCTSSSVCICDAPGMGKTFLLANIARLMTENCTGRLIVFIQLNAFANKFCVGSINTLLQHETLLINVLSYISPSQHNSKLLLELVKANLLSMEICFDGFDEIHFEKVEWTNKVFRSITTNFSNVKIYITSRPHMRQKLESGLGVVAYDILAFNQQNQVDFLVEYWLNHKPDTDQHSLQSYATSCLKAVNDSLTKNDKAIAGIPLLCQLIAEVYADNFAFHLKRKFSDVPLKISGMYQNFIEKRINLVVKSKEDFDNIKLVHVWHALKLLFPYNDFHEDDLFENIKDLLTSRGILRIGILQKHSNVALEFIHRTIAEYLVVEYFCKRLQDKKTYKVFELLKRYKDKLMLKSEKRNCNSMSILKLLLLYDCWTSEFEYPVIVSFLNSVLGEVNISEEMKIQGATLISSTSRNEFISILHKCCLHNLFNIFSFLKESIKKYENYKNVKWFSNEDGYELLEICIQKSTSQMFYLCVQFITEELHLELEQINNLKPFEKYDTLLQMAVGRVNYSAVEYFVNRVPLQNQSLLQQCVKHSDHIKIRESILHLLHNKDTTLIDETQKILFTPHLHVRFFKKLVEFGTSLNVSTDFGRNCAMHAARYMSPNDFHDLVQFLLTDCQAECLFLKNGKWIDPLSTIIQEATLLPETLELLLNIPGNEISIKDRYGENLLFSAAKGNKLDNLQQLLKRGLDYNARGEKNRSLLHAAAERGRLDVVRYLLSLKLDPNSRDKNKWTPLHFALKQYDSPAVVKVLVENGGNVRAKTHTGQTALHFAAAKNCQHFNADIIKYLIEKGAVLNDRDYDGNTPLHICIWPEARNCLIEMGADIYAKNKNRQMPFQFYASRNDPPTTLLQRKEWSLTEIIPVLIAILIVGFLIIF